MLERFLRFALSALVLVLFQPSYSNASIRFGVKYLVSDYVENSDYVLEGRVLYIDENRSHETAFNRVANIEVMKIHHSRDGSSPENLIVEYQFNSDLNQSGMHFVTGSIYRVFINRRADGSLFASLHSGEYGHASQMVYIDKNVQRYFENGEDSFFYGLNCLYDYRAIYPDFLLDEFRFDGGVPGCIETD